MNLDDLSTFVLVAETGSLSGAARALGVPKSTVSRRVTRLEDALGRALLVRTGRAVHLTELGEQLRARAAPSLQRIRDVERELEDAHGTPAGTLRLTAPHDMGATPWFGTLLASFGAAHPAVSIEVELTNRVVDLAAEGLDVAVRPSATVPGDSSSLVVRRLAALAGELFASPAYVAERGAPATPDELIGHACLSHAAVQRGGGWPLRHADGRTAEPKIAPAVLANDFNLLASAALAGGGVAFLPRFAALPHLASGALVPILEGWGLGGGALWLVWPGSRHLAPRVRAFVDHAVAHIEGLELQKPAGALS